MIKKNKLRTILIKLTVVFFVSVLYLISYLRAGKFTVRNEEVYTSKLGTTVHLHNRFLRDDFSLESSKSVLVYGGQTFTNTSKRDQEFSCSFYQPPTAVGNSYIKPTFLEAATNRIASKFGYSFVRTPQTYFPSKITETITLLPGHSMFLVKDIRTDSGTILADHYQARTSTSKLIHCDADPYVEYTFEPAKSQNAVFVSHTSYSDLSHGWVEVKS